MSIFSFLISQCLLWISLFVKVTNQMVTSCKNYITDDNTSALWDQPSAPLIGKLKECCRLYQEYQKCYNRTKQNSEAKPGCRPFRYTTVINFCSSFWSCALYALSRQLQIV